MAFPNFGNNETLSGNFPNYALPARTKPRAGGLKGGRLSRQAEQICKCFAIRIVFRAPCRGRERGIRWLDLLWPSQWTTKKRKQKRAKWRKNARGGKWGTSNGKTGGGGRKGKGTTLCKFCVLTTNPKTQLPPENRHTRALS